MNSKIQLQLLKNSNARILVVDDEERMLDSVLACLEPYNLNLDTANSGELACHKLASQAYDLLLLDLNMPGMDGHQVMEYAANQNIDCEIIVISGESSFGAVSKALRRGAYDYIKKPYSFDELLATISSALQKHSLEQENDQMQNRLQQSEGLHRYIVNSSPDIIFMLDRRGNFTFLNKKVTELLNFGQEELLGKSCLNLIDTKHKRKALHFFRKQFEGKQEMSSFEACLRRNGESNLPRHFVITMFPIDDRELFNSRSSGFRHNFVYGTARDITEQKEAEEFINFQAYHDTLTRLPNRALFKDRLSLAVSQAKRCRELLAVMFLDLDRFKNINDTLGHSTGDLLLERVARRLEDILREGDTLSRFGGDEFTLLLPNLRSPADARHVAEKIIQSLKQPFVIDGNELFIGVSIGVALYPESGKSIDELIKNADQAMYYTKDRGKDGYSFYDQSMTDDLSDQVRLETDLRRAISDNQFVVHYQPQVDIATGQVEGVEALVRWEHPEKGLIYPSDFIDFAEETRLIKDIGDLMLDIACQDVNQWRQKLGVDIRLAVNFSPVQLEGSGFVQALVQKLKLNQFSPKLFELELTENIFMNDMERTAQLLSELSAQGVTVAIDDFGTGYSSLYYLNKLPIHTLKIDRSFIKDIKEGDEACVVDAIAAMAHGLKLNVVVEGIETKTQLDYVRNLGCQQAQGYYYGKPVSAKQLEKGLIRQQDSRRHRIA